MQTLRPYGFGASRDTYIPSNHLKFSRRCGSLHPTRSTLFQTLKAVVSFEIRGNHWLGVWSRDVV